MDCIRKVGYHAIHEIKRRKKQPKLEQKYMRRVVDCKCKEALCETTDVLID